MFENQLLIKGAEMEQWWKRSPPISEAGFDSGPVPYVGWVAPRVLLPLQKLTLQITIQSG